VPFDLRAQRFDEVEQDVDVTDARHVGDLARLIREQARRDQRQCGVLVPFDHHASRQRAAAFYLQ
jgi:hypothetical protein